MKLVEKTESTMELPAPAMPATSSGPRDGSEADEVDGRTNGRRARRTRRESLAVVAPASGRPASDVEVAGEADSVQRGESSDRESRRAARGERRYRDRPRAPLAEKAATQLDPVTISEDEVAGGSPPLTEASTAAAEALVIDLSGKKPNRGARTLKRARRKQDDAAAALEGAEDNPALGALNRHLNMMLQQLGTAHRIIGRIAAERDALRQQLADLQGIPVEEIVVTSIGTSTDQPSSTPKPDVLQQKSGLSRLNYFGGEDVAVMRKRRQGFVFGLLVLVVGLLLAGRMGAFQMPDNLSRESLTGLPYIGDFMTVFLAGWLFFRVIKVSTKGVKWVFPSDDSRRRRR